MNRNICNCSNLANFVLFVYTTAVFYITITTSGQYFKNKKKTLTKRNI